MKIIITSLKTQIKATFIEKTDFIFNYGFENTLYANYANFVNQNKIFICKNLYGFRDNLILETNSINGQMENGTSFKSSRFTSKVIGFEFDNVFHRSINYLISPNNYLNSIISTNNDTFLVEVYAGGGLYFHNEFFITENTSTENQTFQLETSNSSNGVFWKTLSEPLTLNWFGGFEENDGFVEGQFPKVLKRDNYPFQNSLILPVSCFPKIIIGTEKNFGNWENLRIRNVTNSSELIVKNENNDKMLIFDFFNRTCENQDGISRPNELLDQQFYLEKGTNNLDFSIGNFLNLVVDSKYLPLDFKIELMYDIFIAGIEEIGGGC